MVVDFKSINQVVCVLLHKAGGTVESKVPESGAERASSPS